MCASPVKAAVMCLSAAVYLTTTLPEVSGAAIAPCAEKNIHATSPTKYLASDGSCTNATTPCHLLPRTSPSSSWTEERVLSSTKDRRCVAKEGSEKEAAEPTSPNWTKDENYALLQSCRSCTALGVSSDFASFSSGRFVWTTELVNGVVQNYCASGGCAKTSHHFSTQRMPFSYGTRPTESEPSLCFERCAGSQATSGSTTVEVVVSATEDPIISRFPPALLRARREAAEDAKGAQDGHAHSVASTAAPGGATSSAANATVCGKPPRRASKVNCEHPVADNIRCVWDSQNVGSSKCRAWHWPHRTTTSSTTTQQTQRHKTTATTSNLTPTQSKDPFPSFPGLPPRPSSCPGDSQNSEDCSRWSWTSTGADSDPTGFRMVCEWVQVRDSHGGKCVCNFVPEFCGTSISTDTTTTTTTMTATTTVATAVASTLVTTTTATTSEPQPSKENPKASVQFDLRSAVTFGVVALFTATLLVGVKMRKRRKVSRDSPQGSALLSTDSDDDDELIVLRMVSPIAGQARRTTVPFPMSSSSGDTVTSSPSSVSSCEGDWGTANSFVHFHQDPTGLPLLSGSRAAHAALPALRRVAVAHDSTAFNGTLLPLDTAALPPPSTVLDGHCFASIAQTDRNIAASGQHLQHLQLGAHANRAGAVAGLNALRTMNEPTAAREETDISNALDKIIGDNPLQSPPLPVRVPVFFLCVGSVHCAAL